MPEPMKENPKVTALVALAALVVVAVALSACGGSDKPASDDQRDVDARRRAIGLQARHGGQGHADGLGVLQQRPVQHPLGGRADHGRQRVAAQAGVDAPADGQEPVRRLRLDAGHRQRRRLLAGPRLQRAGDRPRERRSALDARSTNSPDQGPNGVVVGGGRVFGATADRRLRARPGDRQADLVREAGPQRHEGIDMAPGYHDGIVYVSTVPVNVEALLPRRRRRASSGRWTPRPARKSGTSTPSPTSLWGRTRTSTPAAASGTRRRSTNKGSMYFGVGNPAPFPGNAGVPVGLEPARPQPLHRLAGQARRQDRQAGVVLPADAARHLRLGLPGPADPGQGRRQGTGDRRRQVRHRRRRSTPRPASCSGSARSASTTATTTTACWRCAAKTRRSRPGEVYPGIARRRDRADGDRRQDGLRPGRQQPADDHAAAANSAKAATMTGEMVAHRRRHRQGQVEPGIPARGLRGADGRQRRRLRHDFDGTVYALDAKTGGELWAAALPAGIQHRRRGQRRHADRAGRPRRRRRPDAGAGRLPAGRVAPSVAGIARRRSMPGRPGDRPWSTSEGRRGRARTSRDARPHKPLSVLIHLQGLEP